MVRLGEGMTPLVPPAGLATPTSGSAGLLLIKDEEAQPDRRVQGARARHARSPRAKELGVKGSRCRRPAMRPPAAAAYAAAGRVGASGRHAARRA